MKNNRSTRRNFIKLSTAGLGLTLPPFSAPAELPILDKGNPKQTQQATPLKVVCVGGHPDDPESGCGGTLARYAEAGHQVTIVYLTRGEGGIEGKSHSEAATIRTAEAQAACKILKTKPVFAGQIDGATEINRTRNAEIAKILSEEKPDLVFTHWPLDTHPDHRAASLLTLNAWVADRQKFHLYFFEVNSGSQTMGFTPTDYVDISPVLEKKKAALFAHKSQGGEEIYRVYHQPMEQFRGLEAGVKAAEAFVYLTAQENRGRIPGL